MKDDARLQILLDAAQAERDEAVAALKECQRSHVENKAQAKAPPPKPAPPPPPPPKIQIPPPRKKVTLRPPSKPVKKGKR